MRPRMKTKGKTLHAQLCENVALLEHRVMMIPRYCDQSYHWNGHNHYTMDMIPPIQQQIEETKAAIAGIEQWRKSKRKKA